MKIAVTSTGPTLDDEIEARFGRCAYFLIIDPHTMEFEAIPNPNLSLGGDAGPQSAQLMADKGVPVVLTGNCGPKAIQTFDAAGITVMTGIIGKVRHVVKRFKEGTLSYTAGTSVQRHFGMGTGGGKGMAGRGGGFGASSGGNCVCPNCGEKASHKLGAPCYEQRCPKCGTAMTRE